MKRIAALAAGLTMLFVAAAPGALAVEFEIPVDTVIYADPGSVIQLVREDTPPELIGTTCVGVAVAENQSSVHPGNDLIIQSGGQSAVLADVERASGAVTPASGQIVLGSEVVVSLRMGEDGVFSGGLVVIIGENCTPPTTTTSSTTTTTTEPPTTTTSSTTTTEPPTPAISIIKDPDQQDVSPGGVATFTITVSNPGPEDLENVRVTDDIALAIDPNSNCPNDTIGTLAVGADFTYECTVAGLAIEDLPWENTAIAIGVGVTSGIEVTDSDPALVVGVGNTTITQPPTTTEAPTTTESPDETLPNTGPGDEVGGFAAVGAAFFLAGAALLGGAALIGRLREER